MGFVTNFVSHPVVSGFTNAAAIIIATSQLPKVFGIRVINSSDSDWASACQPLTMIERIEQLGRDGLHTICNADQNYETIGRLLEAALFYTHIPTLTMALMGIIGIVLIRRIYPRIKENRLLSKSPAVAGFLFPAICSYILM